MTTGRDPEALLSAYLAEGMQVLPDRVVDAVLDEVHGTRQRKVFGPRWARPGSRTAFAAAAVVAAIALGGVLVLGRPGPTPSADPSPSSGAVVPDPTPGATAPDSTAPAGPEGAWIPTGSMGTPRSGHTAIRLLDGRVLVVGGTSDDEPDAVSSAELYDPATGTWSATETMRKPYFGFPPTLLRDGRVFVGTEVYDPESGTWTTTGNVSWSGSADTSTLLRDGTVLVTDGTGSLLFDPDSWTWTAPRFNSLQRHSHAAILLPNGKVLVAGGHAPADFPTNTAEIFDPETGTWTAIASMNARRESIQAFLRPDGKVLVVGGSRGDSLSAEHYDPDAGTWSVVGDAARPEISVSAGATLLADGRVLVRSHILDVAADLFDPDTGSWTTAAPMLRSHADPTILLLDGTVLVAGGEDCLEGVCVATAAAELYVPRGVAPPPLPAFPSAPPPVIPSPTPAPSPFPPAAGPIPPDARSWTVRVVNDSSDPVALFVAQDNAQGIPERLVGSATPNVVPPGATVHVTFLLPRTGGWVIFVNPRPNGDGPLLGATEVDLALGIQIGADGQPSWLSRQ